LPCDAVAALARHAVAIKRRCVHHQNKSVADGSDRYVKLPQPMLAYPDVPRSLELILASGGMPYMRSTTRGKGDKAHARTGTVSW